MPPAAKSKPKTPAPAPAPLPLKTLAALRAEIDTIDHQLFQLLVQRANVIAQVPAVKGKLPVYIRPGREADMVRALLARPHGHLPRGLTFRLWREMIGAFTQKEGRALVCVAMPAGEEGYRDLARDFFGGLTPLCHAHSSAAALRQLRQHKADIALLPWPAKLDDWWLHFGTQQDEKASLFVYAHLPFFGYGHCRKQNLRLLAVSRLLPEKTEADVTVFSCAAAPRLKIELKKAGLQPRQVTRRGERALLEVDGFFSAADIKALLPSMACRWLGAYALPLCPDDFQDRNFHAE